MRNKSILVLSFVSAALFAGSAQAATATAPMAVSAVVVSACLVVAAPLSFGNYSPTASAGTDATSAVLATCTLGTPYNLTADAGIGAGSSIASRTLTGALPLGTTLNYTLYSDAARTAVLGNTVGTNTLAAVGTLLPATHTIYGRIFAGQNAGPGIYADAVVVNLEY